MSPPIILTCYCVDAAHTSASLSTPFTIIGTAAIWCVVESLRSFASLHILSTPSLTSLIARAMAAWRSRPDATSSLTVAQTSPSMLAVELFPDVTSRRSLAGSPSNTDTSCSCLALAGSCTLRTSASSLSDSVDSADVVTS